MSVNSNGGETKLPFEDVKQCKFLVQPRSNLSCRTGTRYHMFGKVEKGALVSKNLTRLGLGNDPDLILKNVHTYGVVAEVPRPNTSDRYYKIHFDGGLCTYLDRYVFSLETNTPYCRKVAPEKIPDKTPQKTQEEVKTQKVDDVSESSGSGEDWHIRQHRRIMSHCDFPADDDDSSIEFVGVKEGKGKGKEKGRSIEVEEKVDDEIMITKAVSPERNKAKTNVQKMVVKDEKKKGDETEKRT
jgi:hypothetical protein